MFEAARSMNKEKFGSVVYENLVVCFGSLLHQVLHELVSDETRASNEHAFHHLKVHVTQNWLHDAVEKSLQTLCTETNQLIYDPPIILLN